MSGIALDKCTLVSIFVESVLWGLFLSLYMITTFFLLQKKSNIRKCVPHLVLVTVMFVLCTLHVGLSFSRVIHAFFGPISPIIYLASMNTIYRLKYGVLFIIMFLGDLLIVFRSWILWNKNYFVALIPALMAVGTLVTAGAALHTMSTTPGLLRQWMIASFTLALATKAVCLSLVVFRVRQIHKVLTAHVNRHIAVYTLLVVLVESGAIALLTAGLLLPTFVAGLNAHVVLSDLLSPITGITVTAIIGGMVIHLSMPGGRTGAAAATAWTRHSLPRSPVSPMCQKAGAGAGVGVGGRKRGAAPWDDFEEDEFEEEGGDDVGVVGAGLGHGAGGAARGRKRASSRTSTASTVPSPVMSRPGSVHHHKVNQSSGTLNMAIVI